MVKKKTKKTHGQRRDQTDGHTDRTPNQLMDEQTMNVIETVRPVRQTQRDRKSSQKKKRLGREIYIVMTDFG